MNDTRPTAASNDPATRTPREGRRARFWRTLLPVYALAALPPIGTLIANLWRGTPGRALYEDPSAYLGAPPYIGMVSLAGNLLWAAAAGGTLVAALVLRNRGDGRAGWLFGAAIANAVLGIDDALLVHDGWLGDVLGVPEPVTFGVYGVALLWWAWRWQASFLQASRRPLLLSAFGLLSFAVGIDALHSDIVGMGFVENSAKFMGLAGWSVAWIGIAADTIVEAMDHEGVGAPH